MPYRAIITYLLGDCSGLQLQTDRRTDGRAAPAHIIYLQYTIAAAYRPQSAILPWSIAARPPVLLLLQMRSTYKQVYSCGCTASRCAACEGGAANSLRWRSHLPPRPLQGLRSSSSTSRQRPAHRTSGAPRPQQLRPSPRPRRAPAAAATPVARRGSALAALHGPAAADAMAAAFDEEDWSGIAEHLRSSEEQRDALNAKVREMQTLAKQAVFALHRGEASRADEVLAKVEVLAAQAQEAHLAGAPHLRQGFYSSAVQDYAVAAIYRRALAERRAPALWERLWECLWGRPAAASWQGGLGELGSRGSGNDAATPLCARRPQGVPARGPAAQVVRAAAGQPRGVPQRRAGLHRGAQQVGAGWPRAGRGRGTAAAPWPTPTPAACAELLWPSACRYYHKHPLPSTRSAPRPPHPPSCPPPPPLLNPPNPRHPGTLSSEPR
jgi:hypothetical protein